MRPIDPQARASDLALPEEAERGDRLIHILYRFFNGQGRLLYVGITAGDPSIRWSVHQRESPWWQDVRFVNVEHLPDRESARAAEIAAIRAENPVHNVADRPGWNPSGKARKLIRERQEERARHGPGPCVSATEARTLMKDLVNEAGCGGPPATITRHNKPVAALINAEDWELLREVRRRRNSEVSD